MSTAPANEVRHDESAQAFVLTVDGEDVLLRYRRPDDSHIDYYSTFTPTSLRGRGLARLVVDAGLQYAEQEQLEVIPSCSYVAKILERLGQA
ncbi:MAG: N-acetyltransferase [Xanthomonadales bacterium]|jgi:predicted GNAT family acetyltransferase|nr:N-acetyltransferase [Xanthomonadales bacterium]